MGDGLYTILWSRKGRAKSTANNGHSMEIFMITRGQHPCACRSFAPPYGGFITSVLVTTRIFLVGDSCPSQRATLILILFTIHHHESTEHVHMYSGCEESTHIHTDEVVFEYVLYTV